jgi:hypothetical protein
MMVKKQSRKAKGHVPKTEEYASVMALCGGGTVPCGLISKRTELHMAFF